MKKKKYLETKFLRFLLERQKQVQDEEEVENSIPEEDLKEIQIEDEENQDEER